MSENALLVCDNGEQVIITNAAHPDDDSFLDFLCEILETDRNNVTPIPRSFYDNVGKRDVLYGYRRIEEDSEDENRDARFFVTLPVRGNVLVYLTPAAWLEAVQGLWPAGAHL